MCLPRRYDARMPTSLRRRDCRRVRVCNHEHVSQGPAGCLKFLIRAPCEPRPAASSRSVSQVHGDRGRHLSLCHRGRHRPPQWRLWRAAEHQEYFRAERSAAALARLWPRPQDAWAVVCVIILSRASLVRDLGYLKVSGLPPVGSESALPRPQRCVKLKVWRQQSAHSSQVTAQAPRGPRKIQWTKSLSLVKTPARAGGQNIFRPCRFDRIPLLMERRFSASPWP